MVFFILFFLKYNSLSYCSSIDWNQHICNSSQIANGMNEQKGFQIFINKGAMKAKLEICLLHWNIALEPTTKYADSDEKIYKYSKIVFYLIVFKNFC